MSGLRKALVLCIKKGRPGAENELKILKTCLEELNFQVSESIDPLGKDILASLKKYRDEMDPRVCCSFVFILAHGKEGKICGSDNATVDLEDVFEVFNNKECPHLQYKPKVFVFQVCRGGKKDSGVGPAFRSMGSEPELLPTISDTFTVYPSQPGFVAYRNEIFGSHMIQEMGKVFKNLADKKHLYDLFVKVNQEMVKINFKVEDKTKKFEYNRKKTCLVMESTLTKLVYLKVPKP
ncbi:caspase-14-like [Amblyraja radiata]|uniref:caspase-14-like n=1 Tax=Amblyraja radiata TaxID=386614 RepID=UPI001402D005|nr:caspase-14-like [Amblyraja radiata]